MTDYREFFPSKYLKEADLKGRAHKLTIDRVERGDEKVSGKPVIYFVGKEKGMVANATNCGAVADAAGTPKIEEWGGTEVEVYPDVVQYNNQSTPCIRIRKPVVAADQFDDDIPF